DAEEERKRLAALPSSECVEHDRERRREEQRAERALKDTGGDQPRRRGGAARRRPAEHRREPEANRPDEDHTSVPEDVAELATEREERGEREQVGVDHPLHARRAER